MPRQLTQQTVQVIVGGQQPQLPAALRPELLYGGVQLLAGAQEAAQHISLLQCGEDAFQQRMIYSPRGRIAFLTTDSYAQCLV